MLDRTAHIPSQLWGRSFESIFLTRKRWGYVIDSFFWGGRVLKNFRVPLNLKGVPYFFAKRKSLNVRMLSSSCHCCLPLKKKSGCSNLRNESDVTHYNIFWASNSILCCDVVDWTDMLVSPYRRICQPESRCLDQCVG